MLLRSRKVSLYKISLFISSRQCCFTFCHSKKNFSCLSQLGKSLSVRSVRLLSCCKCCFLSEDIAKAISFSCEQDVSVVIFETVIKEI